MEEQVAIHIEGCLKKDPQSQEFIYRHCFGNLMKVCLRYHKNADDASASFNKAMHKVFDKLKMYRKDGPFLGWVRRIIVNTCLNDLRRTVIFSHKEIDDDQFPDFNTAPDVYNTISEKEILTFVQELPDACRFVFNLYVMEGYTHVQIAKELGISAGTSKWQLHQARTLLKEKLFRLSINEYAK
jgi:RNA polymerase sigma-70 factor, ECF subfamily